jgi:hypothetical protein
MHNQNSNPMAKPESAPKSTLKEQFSKGSSINIKEQCERMGKVKQKSRLSESRNYGKTKAKKAVNVDSSGNEGNFEHKFRKKRGRDKTRKKEQRRKMKVKKKVKLKSFRASDETKRNMDFVKKSLHIENNKEKMEYQRNLMRKRNGDPSRRKRNTDVIDLVGVPRRKPIRKKRKELCSFRDKKKRKKLEEMENIQNVTISSISEKQNNESQEEKHERIEKTEKNVKAETLMMKTKSLSPNEYNKSFYKESQEKTEPFQKIGGSSNLIIKELPANPQPQDLNNRPLEFYNKMNGNSKLSVKDGTKMIDQRNKLFYIKPHLSHIKTLDNETLGIPKDFKSEKVGENFEQKKEDNDEKKSEIINGKEALKKSSLPTGLIEYVQTGQQSQFKSEMMKIDLKTQELALTKPKNIQKSQEVKINRTLSQLKSLDFENDKQMSSLEIEEKEPVKPTEKPKEKVKIVFVKTPIGNMGCTKEEIISFIKKNKNFFKPNKIKKLKQKRERNILNSKQTTNFKRKKKYFKQKAGFIKLPDMLSCTFGEAQNHQMTNKKAGHKFNNYSNSEKFEKTDDEKSQFEKYRNHSNENLTEKQQRTAFKHDFSMDFNDLPSTQKKKSRKKPRKNESNKYLSDQGTDRSQSVQNERPLTPAQELNLYYDKETNRYIDLNKIQEGSAFVCKNLINDCSKVNKCYSASQNLFCDMVNLFYHTREVGFGKNVQDKKFSEIENLYPPIISSGTDKKVNPNPFLKDKCFCQEHNLSKSKRIKKSKIKRFRTHKKSKRIPEIKTIKKTNKDKKIIPIRNLEKSESLSKDLDVEEEDKDFIQDEMIDSIKNFELPFYVFQKNSEKINKTKDIINKLKEENKDNFHDISSDAIVKKKQNILKQVQEMNLNISSKINRFFIKVKQVDSFLMEKMFAGKWEICVLEMSKLFENKNKIAQYFSLIQALDEDFYWLFIQSNEDSDNQSMYNLFFTYLYIFLL